MIQKKYVYIYIYKKKEQRLAVIHGWSSLISSMVIGIGQIKKYILRW